MLWYYILGVLLFAMATVIVSAWGIVRAQRLPRIMHSRLREKAAAKILKHLKRRGPMTFKELESLIKNVKVSEFGTRKKLVVTHTSDFLKPILKEMEDKGFIKADYTKKPKLYFYRGKNDKS